MRIGLILSGGMAKGAYQIGALRAIGEYLKPEEISCISAASVGALNAIAFSSGNLDDGEKLWTEINRDSDRIFLSTLYKSDYFANTVSQVAELEPKCRKLYTPVLNFRSREVVYPNLLLEDKENRVLYLRAAVAFPPFSRTVNIHGCSYCDGALADNIPYHPLLSCPLDCIICIYFDNYNYIFESEEFTNKIIKIPFTEDSKFLSSSFWFTEQDTLRMIREGYRKTSRILGCVFGGGNNDPEQVCERIRGMNDWNGKNKVRLTGDVIINNVNHLFGRLAKRKIVD